MGSRALLLLTLFPFLSCAGAGGALATAAIVSAVRRANGDCYTICNPGSACNRSTGMCDPLPCGGGCSFEEKCGSTYQGEKCVNVKSVPMP